MSLRRAGRTAGELPTGTLIREAALELFSEVGYDGTSMRGIARAVGVMPASLYNHFTSKEEILWDLVVAATTELESRQDAAAQPSAPVAQRLRTFVRVHVEYHATRSREARIVNRQIDSLSAEHYAQVTAFRDRYERRLRSFIEEGAETGAFRVPHPRIVSYAILQMGMGIANWYRPDGPLSVAEVCDHYVAVADKITA